MYHNTLFRTSSVLLLVILFLYAPSILPEGYIEKRAFNFVASGARSMGMCGAAIAVGGDPTSAYWNPAGLGNINNSQITISYNLWGKSESHMDSFAEYGYVFSDYDSSLDISGIDFISATLPFRQENLFMVHQVSFHRVRNFNYSGSTQNPLTLSIPGVSIAMNELYNCNGSLQALSYSVGFLVMDWLQLGASYHHYMGGYEYENTYQTTYIDTATSMQFSDQIINTMDADFLGDNFDVGFVLSPVSFIRIGGVFKTNYDLKMQYSRNESYSSDFDPDDSIEYLSSGESVIKHPSKWGIGIAIMPVKNLTLACDYSVSDWVPSQNEDGDYIRGTINNYNYPYDPNNPPLEGDTFSYPTFLDPEEITTQEVETYLRIGAEYILDMDDVSFAFRGGYLMHHAIFLDTQWEPVDYTGMSAGLGIYFDFLTFDIAWMQTSAEYKTFYLGSNTPNTKETNNYIYAQLSYLFESF